MNQQNVPQSVPLGGLPGDLWSNIDIIFNKISKLDTIDTQQSNIVSRLNIIESKISENKTLIDTANSKIQAIETSQAFLSDKYDSAFKCSQSNKTDIEKLQSELKVLFDRNTSLQEEDVGIRDDLVDLKCRSMRDNLVFTGIPEHPHSFGDQQPQSMETTTEDDRAGSESRSFASAAAGPVLENCCEKIYGFCESVLKIPNPKRCINIDRAHRMGARSVGKTRAIVVKFKDTDSKVNVKSALKSAQLRNTPYGVFDQYPQEVIEKRRSLIPELIKAREQNKRTVLVRDKLYVNGKLHIPG